MRPSSGVLTINSEDPQSTVAKYKNLLLGFWDVRRIESMFFDNRNDMMYNRRGVCRDTDIGVYNRRCECLGTQCTWNVSLMGWLDMPIVWHEDKSWYMQRQAALLKRSDDPRGCFGSEYCCSNLPYDRFCFIRDPWVLMRLITICDIFVAVTRGYLWAGKTVRSSLGLSQTVVRRTFGVPKS